jgi:hypothetical protein
MSRRARPSGLVLLLLLTWPALALAGEPDASPEPAPPASAPRPASTVVAFDPSDGAGLRETADAWLRQFGHAEGVRFVPISEILAPDQPVVLVGQAEVASCAGEPVGGDALLGLVDEVADRVLMMEYLEASSALERIELALPCLVEAPPSTLLGRYHVLRGLVAFYAEGAEASTARFEEGLLVSPFLQWDETWPPQVRPAFDDAVVGALSAGTAFLSISGRLTAEGKLWLDGLEVDPRTRTTTLYEGTHLLQWQDAEGSLHSWLATVGQGDSLEAVHRRDAVEALLTGTAERGLADYARERVLAPVERERGGRLVVAQPWEVVLFHEYDAAFGRWWLTDLAALRERRGSGARMRTAGQVMLGTGIGAAAIGGLVAALATGEGWDIYGQIFPEGVTLDSGTELGMGQVSVRDAQSVNYNWVRDIAGTGTGILIGGTTVAIAGIPLTVVGHRRATATGLHREPRPRAPGAPSKEPAAKKRGRKNR